MTRLELAMRRTSRRPGFTLVEVLVALAVGAVIVLGARLMLDGVADGARRVARQAQRADRAANAERVLRSTVAALEVSEDERRTFGGDEREAHFTSWCDTPGGWQELCPVTIAIRTESARDGDRQSGTLVLTLAGRPPLTIRRGFTAGALRYLGDSHGGGKWFHTWDAGIAAPVAIGAILDRDTLILRVGVRG